MIVLAIVVGAVMGPPLVWAAWQMRWVRRLERASGDPVALERLLGRR